MIDTVAATPANQSWLQTYYTGRTVFSIAWFVVAVTVGHAIPAVGAALLVAYPAWDALANYVDAQRSGGPGANPTQLANTIVSAAVSAAVAVALTRDVHAAIGVIGAWAALAGLFQLATAIRRWRSARAQWPMILSGAQSTLAGGHFLVQALDAKSVLSVATVAPYAAFGALYFGISAMVLAFSRRG